VGKETVGVMFRKVLKATWSSSHLSSRLDMIAEEWTGMRDGVGRGKAKHLGDHLGCLRERLTALGSRPSEEILD